MSLFDQFSNETLKRVFKFVLKRVIGQYLKEDIVLDQIYVHSRDGVVKIFSLNIDVDLINNEYLNGVGTFRIKSFSIDKLEAIISYSSLLSEGFKLFVSGINIVLEPQSDSHQSDLKSDKSANDADTHNPIFTTTCQSPMTKNTQNFSHSHIDKTADGQQGLNFVAGWVELIISSLQSIAENMQSTIQFPSNCANHKICELPPSLVLFITKFIFSNTIPSKLPLDTSANLAKSLMVSSSIQSVPSSQSQIPTENSFSYNVQSSTASYIQTFSNTKVGGYL